MSCHPQCGAPSFHGSLRYWLKEIFFGNNIHYEHKFSGGSWRHEVPAELNTAGEEVYIWCCLTECLNACLLVFFFFSSDHSFFHSH